MLATGMLAGWFREAGPERQAESEEVTDRRRHEVRATERRETEVRVRRGTERIVDLRDHLLRPELLGRELRRHDVPVVAFGHRHEQVGVLGARAAERVLVRSV